MKTMFASIYLLVFLSCANTQNSKLYNKEKVLSELNTILNSSVPEYKSITENGFSNTSEGVTIGYTVRDLTDTTNVNKRTPDDKGDGIKFIENHFYHFVPVIMPMSYSHIAYLEDGNIKVFKSINCTDIGDDFDDFIAFAKTKLIEKEDVLENLKNYRKFGEYLVEDNYGMTVNCECNPCE